MPNYRVTFFRKLIELGNKDYIKYEVFAGTAPQDSSNRGDKTLFNDFYTHTRTTEIKCFNRSFVFHHLPRNWSKVDLVIAENAIRNFHLYRWVFFSRPQNLALWGHGKTYTKRNTTLEEWVKTRLVNRADWFFGYTELGVQSVIMKGFSRERTTIVLNSTDSESIIESILDIKAEHVEEFVKDFEIRGDNVCCFVGALDKSKRLEFLIESAKKIQQEIPTFQLLIFGDGPERSKLLEMIKNLPYIKFIGRADTRLMAINSKVSKLILMPGRVGLIAVDSFALGIPIVTTDWPFHAPEFEYLRNGFTSVISKDNLNDFAGAVTNLLLDQESLIVLRKNCLEASANYTITAMAENFHSGVLKALELKELDITRILRRKNE
jgi:glycosyltransferase involved in cell wall biosynthesis